jgi:hypothetical protein
VCRWVGCIFQLWSVTTVAKAAVVTDYDFKTNVHLAGLLFIAVIWQVVVKAEMELQIE